MRQTKYQSPMTSSYEQEYFLKYPYISHVNNVSSGAGHFFFLPHRHYLNNFGRDPLDDVPCQISKLKGLWFQRRFFNISLYISIGIKCPLGRGHFWPHGHYLNNFARDPLDKAPCEISKLLN